MRGYNDSSLSDYQHEFDYDMLLDETDKAYHVQIEGYETWLPKSQVKLKPDTLTIMIPEWLAQNHKLL